LIFASMKNNGENEMLIDNEYFQILGLYQKPSARKLFYYFYSNRRGKNLGYTGAELKVDGGISAM